MIRAVIQARFGKTPRAAVAEPSKPMNWFWPAVALLLLTIEFLAGWSINFSVFLAALLVLHAIWLAARRDETEHRLSFPLYIAALTACCASIATLSWFAYDPAAETAALIGVMLGTFVTDMIDGSRHKILPADSPQHMLHWIAEPLLFKRPGTDLPERIEPRYPFKSQSDGGVWAIDPDRRAVRVMLPSEDDLDIVLPWDEPVRAVTLRHYRHRLYPLGGHIGPMLNGDRELLVTSGADKAGAWTHIFHFAGADKELAARWRDAFESWMREDQRAAMASPR
jgi:hypothetical protein